MPIESGRELYKTRKGKAGGVVVAIYLPATPHPHNHPSTRQVFLI